MVSSNLSKTLALFGTSRERRLVEAALPYYYTPTRQYHDWDHAAHVSEVAHRLLVAEPPADPEAPSVSETVLAAVWHDAVYIPGFGHNESASVAAFNHAVRSLYSSRSEDATAGPPPFRPDVVSKLIETTKVGCHLYTDEQVRLNLDPICFPLMDADLSSLAAPYKSFLINQQHIAFEQTGILFNYHRLKVSADWLGGFLERREYIYHTKTARDLYEKAARDNIFKFRKTVLDGSGPDSHF